MKTILQNLLTLSFFSLTLLSACSRGGFQAADMTSLPGNENDGSGGRNPQAPNPNLADQVNKLDLRTYFNGQLVADIDKTGDGYLIVRIPLGFTAIFSIGAGAHQKYKDINFSLEGNIANGFALVVKIPLKYILRLGKFETAAPGRLPNGDALPKVPSGELPMLNISVNATKKEKIYLYLSKEYVGILFETKFDPDSGFEYELKDRYDLRTVGFFHLIAAKNNAPAAFMLSIQFPPKVATLLDDYFKN